MSRRGYRLNTTAAIGAGASPSGSYGKLRLRLGYGAYDSIWTSELADQFGVRATGSRDLVDPNPIFIERQTHCH